MVIVSLQLQVPDYVAADDFEKVMRDGCDGREGWKLLGFTRGDMPPCPECGEPMRYDATLQAHACSHSE